MFTELVAYDEKDEHRYLDVQVSFTELVLILALEGSYTDIRSDE